MRIVAALLSVVLSAQWQTVCTLRDDRITEASGLGVGILHPNVLYVENDSGDDPRFFAINSRTGKTRAVWDVPGAEAVDWEDATVGLDQRGVSSVYLADIGDNYALRSEVRVYRVDEPSGSKGGNTGAPDVWRLRYPDGPSNAEALAVAPGGHAYIVTKVEGGRSAVYALPDEPDPRRVQQLRKIAEFRPQGSADERATLLVTGATFSPDGRVFAIRTYTDAYLWHVGANTAAGLAAALVTDPVRIGLPSQKQGEGIALAERRLLIDSEGSDEPVLALDLPDEFRSVRPTPSPVPPPSTSTATAPSTSAPTADTSDFIPWLVGAVGLVVLVVGIVLAWRERR